MYLYQKYKNTTNITTVICETAPKSINYQKNYNNTKKLHKRVNSNFLLDFLIQRAFVETLRID